MTDVFSKFDHYALVVKDMDKAIAHYESLGIGPFQPPSPVDRKERNWVGEPIDFASIKNIYRVVDLGSIRIELVQPVEGKSKERDFLETRGEGIDHVGYRVDDIDKAEKELVAKGHKLFYRARYNPNGGASYFDTRKVSGYWIELIQWPSGWKSQIA